jgi:hypothetical protein
VTPPIFSRGLIHAPVLVENRYCWDMGQYTMKMQAVLTPADNVGVGDELVYVDKNHTCHLSKQDGSTLGVEIKGGVVRLIAGEYGFADGPWTPQMAVSVASSLARQAGLLGEVQQVEGSISTIYRVRILK